MEDGLWGSLRGLGYRRARQLLLTAGLAVLAVTALIMFIRRVDTTEVAGTLLFMPVFVAFVFWGARGGLVAGTLAAVAYGLLRYPAIDAVGAGRFMSLIMSRAFAYLAFGGIGGWAASQLENSLTKLELYDQIDDATGLYNARFFVQDTDLEMSRSRRYQTIFSIAAIDIPMTTFEPLRRRQRRALLKDLGRLVRDGVRAVDRPVHALGEDRFRFAIVLPETGTQGAGIFTDRLVGTLVDTLRRRSINVAPEDLTRRALTFPEDEQAIESLRNEFAAIDRVEHPEAAAEEVPA